MPKNTEPPVEPFTPEEVEKILAAIEHYPDKQNAIRLRALILLLRYSGLRLGDAVTVSRDRIENGTLILRTEKTGTRVRVPLPQEVTDAIAACPGPRYPFWSGNGKRKSVVTNWQRALKTLFDLAGVSGAHAHRYWHTFACEMLMAGVSLTIVAKLLGHSSEGYHGAALRRLGKGPAGATRGGGTTGFSVQVRGDDRSKTGRTEKVDVEKLAKSQQIRTKIDGGGGGS
jgi:integrase